MTQYGIKYFLVYAGRSTKCYVNPLNDLFRLPTITTQRWLAADTGAHLSFCPGPSLSVAPPTVRGVGQGAQWHSLPVDEASVDPLMATMLVVVIMFGLFPASHLLLGFYPTYNPGHETQREASHACPSEFQRCLAQTGFLCAVLTAVYWLPVGHFIMSIYYREYCDRWNHNHTIYTNS